MRQDLTIQPLGDETLVYDPRRATAHRLGAAATLTFQACREQHGRDRLVAALLHARLAASEAEAEFLIEAILDELEILALVVPRPNRLATGGLPTGGLPTGGLSSPTRRELLGTSFKVALALPFVTSLVAPTPAAAVSLAAGVDGPIAGYPGGLVTEEYDHFEDNPFREVALHPTSTFAADADTASYANVRRFLRSGQLPPPEAVRLEELLAAFRWDSSVATHGADLLAVDAELAECPWAPDHQLLCLTVATEPIDTADLPPRNLVLLLDVSGSMDAPNKLPLVKTAFSRLITTLGARDRIAIVVYAGASGVVLPSTPGDHHTSILAALDNLQAGGATRGSDGLELAYRVAAESFVPDGINRVLLATDGDFNLGVTSRGGLIALIERERERGIDLSVLGFGSGNLKDSTMEQLADHGNGNYTVIDSVAAARRCLVELGGATLVTVARDVKLQLEWNPLEVRAWRLLGFENRLLSREDFVDDRADGGELGAGHQMLVLFELITAGSEEPGRFATNLRYQQPGGLTSAAGSGEVGVLRLRAKAAVGAASVERTYPLDRAALVTMSPGPNFRLAAGVATFGQLLRNSRHRGSASYPLAANLVASTLDHADGATRAELLELIEVAAGLATGAA